MASPAVTVLMPVYNGARFLAEAVSSVLNQTFRDFELLAINDGSSDSSPEILASFHDPRIRIIDNGRNLGIIATLNKGLDLARSEYVARMDADDACYPNRLAVQISFMRSRPEVGAAGAWYRPIGKVLSRAVRLPTSYDEICAWMPFHCPIAHPTVILRRKSFVENGLSYDPGFPHAEDYDLWSRASRVMRLANVARVLLRYRAHGEQITSRHAGAQFNSAKLVRGRELARLLPEVVPAEIEFHHQILTSAFERDPVTLSRIETWLLRLERENQRTGIFPRELFGRAIGKVWLSASLDCMPQFWAYSLFVRSPLTGLLGHRAAIVAGFGARALKRFVSGNAT